MGSIGTLYPTETASDRAYLPFGGGAASKCRRPVRHDGGDGSFSWLPAELRLEFAGKTDTPDKVGTNTGATIHTRHPALDEGTERQGGSDPSPRRGCPPSRFPAVGNNSHGPERACLRAGSRPALSRSAAEKVKGDVGVVCGARKPLGTPARRGGSGMRNRRHMVGDHAATAATSATGAVLLGDQGDRGDCGSASSCSMVRDAAALGHGDEPPREERDAERPVALVELGDAVAGPHLPDQVRGDGRHRAALVDGNSAQVVEGTSNVVGVCEPSGERVFW